MRKKITYTLTSFALKKNNFGFLEKMTKSRNSYPVRQKSSDKNETRGASSHFVYTLYKHLY